MKNDSMPAMAVRAVERWDVLLKSSVTERQFFEVLARPYFAPLTPILRPADFLRQVRR